MNRYLHNSNGESYEILAQYIQLGEQHYLLASHKGREDSSPATITQYIIARRWSDSARCWAQGNYYPIWQDNARWRALEDWQALIIATIDNF